MKEISSFAIDSQTYTNFANQTYKQMQTDTKQEILKNRLMEAVGNREGWGGEEIEKGGRRKRSSILQKILKHIQSL